MAYQIAEIVMTLSDLQGHSPTIACPSVLFFRTAVVSRGPSAYN